MKAEGSDTEGDFRGVEKPEKIIENFSRFNLESKKQTAYLCIRFRR